MNVQLRLLTDRVLEELHIVMEDNPDMTEDEAVDWAYELADQFTPPYDYDVLMLAVNNLTLIGYRDIPRGVLDATTPVVVVAREAVFDYLIEVVYSEWHGHQQGKQEE